MLLAQVLPRHGTRKRRKYNKYASQLTRFCWWQGTVTRARPPCPGHRAGCQAVTGDAQEANLATACANGDTRWSQVTEDEVDTTEGEEVD